MGTALVTLFCSVTSLDLLWALTCRGSSVAVQSSAKPLVTALPKLVKIILKRWVGVGVGVEGGRTIRQRLPNTVTLKVCVDSHHNCNNGLWCPVS